MKSLGEAGSSLGDQKVLIFPTSDGGHHIAEEQ
jgi:hypothetical protein